MNAIASGKEEIVSQTHEKIAEKSETVPTLEELIERVKQLEKELIFARTYIHDKIDMLSLATGVREREKCYWTDERISESMENFGYVYLENRFKEIETNSKEQTVTKADLLFKHLQKNLCIGKRTMKTADVAKFFKTKNRSSMIDLMKEVERLYPQRAVHEEDKKTHYIRLTDAEYNRLIQNDGLNMDV